MVSSSGRGDRRGLPKSSPRSPDACCFGSPLHLNNNPDCRRYGFTWQKLHPSRHARPGEAGLSGAFVQRRGVFHADVDVVALRATSLSSPSTVVSSKFVNANMMLYWLLQQFPVPVRAVLMIRHPCAVVSSQIVHGIVGQSDEGVLHHTGVPLRGLPSFPGCVRPISEPEEVLAFEWATQTHVPLSQPRPHPWLLTTYEHIVEQGRDEVDRIFAYLGEPVPTAAYDALRTASATTVSHSNVAAGEKPTQRLAESPDTPPDRECPEGYARHGDCQLLRSSLATP